MADSRPESASDASTAASSEALVEDVLREAQALLDGADATIEPPSAEADVPSDDISKFDVQGLVDRVDGLLGDFGHLIEDVASADRSGPAAGLDLTLVLPKATPDPQDIVPDHGPSGPQVDLFAAPEPASEPESPSGRETATTEPSVSPPLEVVLETESTATTQPAEVETIDQVPTASAEASLLDDLSAALADEFDEPGLATGAPVVESKVDTIAEPAQKASSPAELAAEASLLAAMTEEFGSEPVALPPVEDEGDPFESLAAASAEPSEAARRLEALLARRLAEEYDLVEQAVTTTPTVIEREADATVLAQADIDAVARAEIEALEALGSDLGEGTPAGEVPEVVDDSIVTSEPADAEPADAVQPAPSTAAVEQPTVTNPVTNPVTNAGEGAVEAAMPDADPIDATGSDDAADVPPAMSIPESTADADRPETDDAEKEVRPNARRPGPSLLIRLGAAPFRHLPRGLHRHATPVALSLLAWVPLAWGFALLAPTPVPPRLDVLHAGLHVDPGHSDAPSPSGSDASSEGSSSTADHHGESVHGENAHDGDDHGDVVQVEHAAAGSGHAHH